MTVWLLLMVLVNAVPGLESSTKLNEFSTPEECQQEQERIGKDMADAYPGDTSFRIDCNKATKPDDSHINYTKIIRDWADTKHPGFSYTLKVMKVKQVEMPADSSNGPKISMVFQIVLNYVNGNSQSFIVFIGEDSRLYAWVETEIPNEGEPVEEFPEKDKT